jgi:hypothetical protein
VPCSKSCGKLFVKLVEANRHAKRCSGNLAGEEGANHGGASADMLEAVDEATCDVCGTVMRGNGAAWRIRMHVEAVHLKIKKHKCGSCDEAFQHEASLRRHKARAHGIGGEQAQILLAICLFALTKEIKTCNNMY